MELAGGNGTTIPNVNPNPVAKKVEKQEEDKPKAESSPSSESVLSPWIESDECTSCDECININSKIFAYNKDKQAYIKDPKGGPYQDLVIAAEKCTAQVIHPGLPVDPSAKDMDKWIKRGEKFN